VAASLLMTFSSLELQAADLRLEWKNFPPVPDSLGLGGAYGGKSGKALLVVGGSNFPDKMPWEGGTKAWLNDIYVLESPGGKWKKASAFPLRAGYGVSASTSEGLVCAGGSDANAHLTDVFLLVWKRGKLEIRTLPPLPVPLAYSCGSVLDDSVYVAGGTDSPTATSTRKEFLRLDMKQLDSGWQELPTWPGGPRMLATAAVADGSLFIVGGTDLHPDEKGNPVRTYLNDGYRFTPGSGWRRIANLPNPVVAAPSPAPMLKDGSFLLVGGDDGSLVGFEPRSKHPGFPKRVLRYDAKTDKWSVAADAPVSRATLPTAVWQGYDILISGEARPGVRSPEVWGVRAAKAEGTPAPHRPIKRSGSAGTTGGAE
jgi:N-acetylneuraminate epimerase